MNATLHALAAFYRRSSAARTGAVKDYIVVQAGDDAFS